LQLKNSNLLTAAIIKNIKLRHIGLAAAKGILVLIRHFWRQDVLSVKSVVSSCPASTL